MKVELIKAIQAVCQELFSVDVAVELTRPDEQFGDFSTNIAMKAYAEFARATDSHVGDDVIWVGPNVKNPRELAEVLADKLRNHDSIADVTVAGPGFLNLTLTDAALFELAESEQDTPLAGQTIVAEYSDPNPFKVLHAGHLYTSVVGDAIANLLEHAGGQVHRVNFGGDVGLHVGKTMWAILKKLGGEHPDKLSDIPAEERSEWMAAAYVEGNNAYDDNEDSRAEMIALNKRVYQLHVDDDRESPFAHIYWTCRDWSYQYFDAFYARIGSKFEKYYPESEVAELGLKTVQENTGTTFVESEGAIVFKGEDHGLHTRVFINREGIPTYEAKDVGLIMQKKRDYDFDRSVVITGNEQLQYMQVVLKAIEQFAPQLSNATSHLTHGLVKLAGGVKMSSRKGNILRAVDVLDVAAEANERLTGNQDEEVVLAAVKYAFLKQRLGGDIVYDPEESVAIEGNSGPYIQYAHARARSILAKTDAKPEQLDELQDDERSLLRKVSEYPEVIEKATDELMPHHICTYLYELAQTFNRFYEKNRVIDDPRQGVRLKLVTDYASTLKNGLSLLGIHAPDHM